MLPCFILPPIEAHGARAWPQHLLEKARQQIAELENLFEHAPLVYYSVDEKGYILKINYMALECLGYSNRCLSWLAG